jgi:hypothetical protein
LGASFFSQAAANKIINIPMKIIWDPRKYLRPVAGFFPEGIGLPPLSGIAP